MILKKHVLMVDAPSDDLAQSADELKRLGYEVALAENLETALAAVVQFERLSLIVVNCANNAADYLHFVAAVRGLHPNLPIIWLSDSYRVVTRFLESPCAWGTRSDVSGLAQSAAKLLHEEFYGNDLAEELVDAAQEVLSQYGMVPQRSEPYLKSSLTALSDVNALIGFAGEGMSGHLILSASTENARALYLLTIPDQPEPHYDDLEDLLGEITNRILGSLKCVFERRALSFKLKTPAFIRGPHARYRRKGAPTSLAVEFIDQHGLLRLEFCVDRWSRQPVMPRVDTQFMEAGQIQFL